MQLHNVLMGVQSMIQRPIAFREYSNIFGP
jgi:hypothetical protein